MTLKVQLSACGRDRQRRQSLDRPPPLPLLMVRRVRALVLPLYLPPLSRLRAVARPFSSLLCAEKVRGGTQSAVRRNSVGIGHQAMDVLPA